MSTAQPSEARHDCSLCSEQASDPLPNVQLARVNLTSRSPSGNLAWKDVLIAQRDAEIAELKKPRTRKNPKRDDEKTTHADQAVGLANPS